jgi:hypothetical protein
MDINLKLQGLRCHLPCSFRQLLMYNADHLESEKCTKKIHCILGVFEEDLSLNYEPFERDRDSKLKTIIQ